MIVDLSLLDEIYVIYLDCYGNGEPNSSALNLNRRKVKIIIDSIYEQSVENIIGNKPRNFMDARKIINEYLVKNNDCKHRKYLNSLNNVLKNYQRLIDSGYIDRSEGMDELLRVQLSKHCTQLCIETSANDRPSVKILLNLLRSL